MLVVARCVLLDVCCLLAVVCYVLFVVCSLMVVVWCVLFVYCSSWYFVRCVLPVVSCLLLDVLFSVCWLLCVCGVLSVVRCLFLLFGVYCALFVAC